MRSIRPSSIWLWVFITLMLASSSREVSIIVVISVVGCTADISRQPPATARSPGATARTSPSGRKRFSPPLTRSPSDAGLTICNSCRVPPWLTLPGGINFPRARRGAERDRRVALAENRVALLRNQFAGGREAKIAGPREQPFLALADDEEAVALQGHVGGISGLSQRPGGEIGHGLAELHAAADVVDRPGARRRHAPLDRLGIARLHDGQVALEAHGIDVGDVVGDDLQPPALDLGAFGRDVESVRHVRSLESVKRLN